MKTNKAEIYKNAFRLFLQDDYKKVTGVKLEKAIGLSCRGIYHHTKDKLGLFKAVVDTYIFEPHKVENKFVFAEDISLRDFLQTYIEGVERTMEYLSNELGVDRKECAKCYFQFLFQAYKYLADRESGFEGLGSSTVGFLAASSWSYLRSSLAFFCSIFFFSCSAIICANGFTDSGDSLLKRLK